MLSVDEVLGLITKIVVPREAMPVELGKAVGLVLAADVKMDGDSPPFDRSQLDGFAIASMDAKEGAELQVAGRVDAGGALFGGAVGGGRCVGINTGGVVPAGADGILMVEHAEVFRRGDAEWVRVKRAVPAGYGIQRRGSDASDGQVVLRAGAVLQAAQIAVCAAAGVERPLIRRADVSVLTTGDELLLSPLQRDAATGKIRNSNGPLLCALAAETGAAVHDLGNCADDPVALREILQRGLAMADLLIVSGGMSMGTRDFVPQLLQELGVVLHVEKVRIKPGKPFVLGTLAVAGGRKYVAGLPGNPVSAFVTFQRFVRPVLACITGTSGADARLLRVRCADALEANGDREFYQPCQLNPAGHMEARLLKWKGSADLFTLARADGLIIRPAKAPALPANSDVEVLLI